MRKKAEVERKRIHCAAQKAKVTQALQIAGPTMDSVTLDQPQDVNTPGTRGASNVQACTVKVALSINEDGNSVTLKLKLVIALKKLDRPVGSKNSSVLDGRAKKALPNRLGTANQVQFEHHCICK